jgi:hypothetical protein
VDTAGGWIVGVSNPLSNSVYEMLFQQLTPEECEVISQMHYSGSVPTPIGLVIRHDAFGSCANSDDV